MEDIWQKLWKVLGPKSRSSISSKPRISDGSYPVEQRWPWRHDTYERDREMYRRHEEGNFPLSRNKPTEVEENKEKEVKMEEESTDWKIRDEQYREDDARVRRHEEGYWSKVEEFKSSSSTENPPSDNSSSKDSSEKK